MDDLTEKVFTQESNRGVSNKRSLSPNKKEAGRNQYSSVDSGPGANLKSQRKQQELEERIQQMEDPLQLSPVQNHSSLDRLEQGVSRQREDWSISTFAKEVDRALKDMEERIYKLVEGKTFESRQDGL